MSRLGRRATVSAFLRSFLIQGSWNYHTMLGSGFAFAMLPALRRLFRDDPDGFDAALRRHLEHFNAHPYLSTLALGASLRLEADGADPEVVRRFKTAVRSPLGSLGDALVWAAWLPAVSLAALSLFWLGAPTWLSVATFVVVYNVGHVGLRIWGFRAGLAEGQGVASRLARADLGVWTDRVRAVAALLLGLVAGTMLAGDYGLWTAGPVWAGLGVATFVTGFAVGHKAWRPAAATVVAAVAVCAIWGMK